MTANTAGIYLITNLVTGMKYVGSSKRLAIRITTHKNQLRQGIHNNKGLQADWVKYGAESFSFTIIENVANKDDQVIREQYWIDAFGREGRIYNVFRVAIVGGRKAIGAEAMVVVPVRLTPNQKAKLERLGGATWLRQEIDEESFAAEE